MADRRKVTTTGGVVALLLIAALGGCRASETVRDQPPPLATQRSLVIAPQVPTEDEAYAAVPWERARNDDRLGIGRRSGLDEFRAIRETTHDWRSTVNGRVHENSRTYTRTIRRGIMYY
ncbi:MAG: hypothetical protein GY715_11350 [Planctomycetes bacterium]|nr:hypothetical protein [Planctomycetota bacterium]